MVASSAGIVVVEARPKRGLVRKWRRVYFTAEFEPRWSKRGCVGTVQGNHLGKTQQWAARKGYELRTDPFDPTPHVTGKKAGVHAHLLNALEKFAMTHRVTIYVLSGYRSYAEQVKLYALYLAGKGNLAAKPGTSQHGRGEAVDIYIDGVAFWAWCDAHGLRTEAEHFGLRQAVPSEAWHTEHVA